MKKITADELKPLLKELQDGIKLLQLTYPCPELRRDWLPRHEVMQYLGFASTQMSAIAKTYDLKTSTIGKRKFYNVKQLSEILNQQPQ